MLFHILTDDLHIQKEITEALGISSEGYGFKWPLPNLKPSSERDYWFWRSMYSFRAEVSALEHQIKGDWATVLLYYVGHSKHIDGGFAVCVFYGSDKERVEYYTWSRCDHVFKVRNVGRCLNRYTCEHCGKSYEIDSSD